MSFKYVNKYNSKGQKIEDIGYESNGELSSKTIYHYNDNGRLSKTEEFMDTDNPISLSLYKYDSNGRKIETTLEYVDKIYTSIFPPTKSKFYYDAADRLIEHKGYTLKFMFGENQEILDYSYKYEYLE